jgi:alkylated DNA repair dioxygenase AlkB
MITGRFDLELLAKELYDFSKPGIVQIKAALNENLIEELFHEVQKGPFQPVLVRKGGLQVREDVTYFTTGEIERENKTSSRFPDLEQLQAEYKKIYCRLGEKNKFSDTPLNSAAVYKYEPGSEGMGPHRDYAENSNLISIFSLSGKAIFYSCSDREKNDLVSYQIDPGDCILLRAARCPEEQAFRPFHYVEHKEGTRICIALRAKDEQLQKTRLTKYYGGA